MEEKTTGNLFGEFAELIASLRGENGCPWDKKQTIQKMAKYLREETEEAIEQIELGNSAGICEELGDVLLIITMMSRIAEESGEFSLEDVVRGISEKIVRRHPHVFNGLNVSGEEEIIANWERIKQEEKRSAEGLK